MKKLSAFAVRYRYAAALTMLALTVLCAFLIPRVEINTDMTKYLSDDSVMKQGLSVMETEFPDSSSYQTIRVMFRGLSDAQKEEIKTSLAQIKNVAGIEYAAGSDDYDKDGYTLYILETEYDYDSKEEKAIRQTLEDEYSGYEMECMNDNTASSEIPLSIMVCALTLLMVILIAMSRSWVEPLLFAATVGMAVVLNMGTNIFLGSISITTFSIAAILQLVLSMDYSIILSSRYRDERAVTDDKKEAMKNALAKSFSSVVSSSLTTVVGLLALVFMSFRIGEDIGTVLAKGVFISMVCVLTVLPCLLMLFDGAIKKTEKRSLHIPTDGISHFAYRFRRVIAVFFAILFAGSAYLQTLTNTAYTLSGDDPIKEVFPNVNTLVIVYDNADEGRISGLEAMLSDNESTKSVTSYDNTLGKKYDLAGIKALISEQGDSLPITETGLGLIWYLASGKGEGEMTLAQFSAFALSLSSDESLADLLPEGTAQALKSFAALTDKAALTAPADAKTLSSLLSLDEASVNGLIALYAQMTGADVKDGVSAYALLSFLGNSDVQSALSGTLGQEAIASLSALGALADAVVKDEKFNSGTLSSLLSSFGLTLDENSLSALFVLYQSRGFDGAGQTKTLSELLTEANELSLDARFSSFFGESEKEQLSAAANALADGKKELVGEKHSRMTVTTLLPSESDETNEYIDSIDNYCKANFTGEYYIVGSSAMNREMKNGFGDEMLLITLLTAISIFVVVLLTFRSFAMPLILVLLVQCGVFITVSVIGLQGYSIYYLALLMVQCILMGATIDYGILFTNRYRESRQTLPPREAVTEAYRGSVHTIMTSGLIIILVTAVLGWFFDDPTISQICRTISIGALSAVLLVLFVLPGLLVTLDRFVAKRKKKQKDDQS